MKMCRFLFVPVFIAGLIRMSHGSCEGIHKCMEENDKNYKRNMLDYAYTAKTFTDSLCSYSEKALLVACIDEITTDDEIDNTYTNSGCKPVDAYFPIDLDQYSALAYYNEVCSDKDEDEGDDDDDDEDENEDKDRKDKNKNKNKKTDGLKEFIECFKKPKMKEEKSKCPKCLKKAATKKSKCNTQAVSNKPSKSSGCSECQSMHCIRKAMNELCHAKAVKIYDKRVKALCCGSKICIELVVLVGFPLFPAYFQRCKVVL